METGMIIMGIAGIMLIFGVVTIGWLPKKLIKKMEEEYKKNEKQLTTVKMLKDELIKFLQENIDKPQIVNGYRAVGIVQLTPEDFDSIPSLNRDLDGFDTVSQQIVFQMKYKIRDEWYLLDVFKMDNEVNTGVTKIEMVDGY